MKNNRDLSYQEAQFVVKKKQNQIDADLYDLKEKQQNQNNPGYYVGPTGGRRHLAGLSGQPILLIILGSIYFIVMGLLVWKKVVGFSIYSLWTGVVPLALIIGGIQRLRGR